MKSKCINAEEISDVGVSAYALMAAGGDFGASFAPQTMGIVVDKISGSQWTQTLGNTLFLSAEQVGFRVGILIATIFSILGLLLVVYMRRFFKVGLKLFCLSGIGVGCISR